MWVVELCAEKHQFGDGCLYGTVIAGYHSHVLELVACVVSAHLHRSGHALTDVDDDNASLCGLAQHVAEPRALWRVATAEGAHHDAAQLLGLEKVVHDFLLNAGEETEYGYVGIEGQMGNHGPVEVGLKDVVVVERKVDTSLAEMGIVEAVERIEPVGVDFR